VGHAGERILQTGARILREVAAHSVSQIPQQDPAFARVVGQRGWLERGWALGLVGCWNLLVVCLRPGCECHRGGGFLSVKIKILLVILAGLGAFAVWRKVQADRAELDLWNEATAADED
jgi:hypothetical protein